MLAGDENDPAAPRAHPPGDIDPSTEATIHAMALDGAGRLYVTGTFDGASTIGAENIALWDGAAWHALGSGVNQTGYALALDLDLGGVFVGGLFTQAGTRPAPRVAHWVWPLFVDGFESGDPSSWSASAP